MGGLRLSSMLVENFRSISGRWEIPLDADVVLVHGPNGAGKTSLLSALELAATGSIGFIDGEGGIGQALLTNRNYPLGRVELRLDSDDGSRVGGYEFDSRGRRGKPALGTKERIDLLERGLLPQTALGRLLESYSKRESVDSALVRFVKDLVGVEELDAVIDGLYVAGHIARIRSASPAWSRGESYLTELETEEAGSRAHVSELERAVAHSVATLRSMHSDINADDPQEVLSAARALTLAADADRAELSILENRKLRLEGVALSLEELSDGAARNSDESLASESVKARETLDRWESGEGAKALSVVNKIREQLEMPLVGGSELFTAFEDIERRISSLSRIEREAAEAIAAQKSRRGQLAEEILATDSELSQLRMKSSSIVLPEDTRTLIDLLPMVLPLVTSADCPVCEQKYPGGEEALHTHLASRIETLSDAAQQYAGLSEQLSKVAVRREEIALEIQQLDAGLAMTNPAGQAEPLIRRLNEVRSEVDHGAELLRGVESGQARLADIASFRSRIRAAEQGLVSILAEMNLTRDDTELSQQVQAAALMVEKGVQDAQFRIAVAERTRTAVSELAQRLGELAEYRANAEALASRIQELRLQQREASRRKTVANELRHAAERQRSRVINAVFDSALNESWSDFFTRFVPQEPFVPQFKKQQSGSRTIDISLETVAPGGSSYGSPTSVLSFGNANTAALSLFLALHMSAPTSVDWLIFDDPVQSMDDIHIANFAAVVRQLTLSHNRQVIIAVHQRELFDYLAFELAPATPGEVLLKVNLDRQSETTQITTERVEYAAEKAIELGLGRQYVEQG